MQVRHSGLAKESLGNRRLQELGDFSQFILRIQGTTPCEDANLLPGIQNLCGAGKVVRTRYHDRLAEIGAGMDGAVLVFRLGSRRFLDIIGKDDRRDGPLG